ncbi:hypothetical protein ABIE19_000534 [Brevundimonas faecalis]|uniref:Uncharacterized protein n=1 Tax=Brevundimonas faecalis TaxID=947378 RepID=A0ABV2R7R6_9CAUL
MTSATLAALKPFVRNSRLAASSARRRQHPSLRLVRGSEVSHNHPVSEQMEHLCERQSHRAHIAGFKLLRDPLTAAGGDPRRIAGASTVRRQSLGSDNDEIEAKMTTRARILTQILMIVVGIAPLASVALAGFIADLNSCELHEGYPQTCLVLGVDIGGALYTMTVMGWLMLISLFFLAGGLLGLAWEGILLLLRTLWPKLRH